MLTYLKLAVLSFIKNKIILITPFVENLHAIKGMCVIFTFGVGRLDGSSEPIQCALCE